MCWVPRLTFPPLRRARSTRVRGVLVVLACVASACHEPTPGHEATQPVPTAAPRVTEPAREPATTAKPAPPPPTVHGTADRTNPQPGSEPSLLPFLHAPLDQDAIVQTMLTAPVVRYRPAGTSSIVFRVTLEGAFDAAFKSSSERRPRAHAAEVTAYRIARLLGLDNVPPAVTRRVPANEMRTRMVPPKAWRELRGWIGIEDSFVTGAAIYWIDGIRESGVDSRKGTRRYTEWLRHDGELAERDRSLARDISNMIAFDCVIGNWDRWSGGNAKGDAAGQRLYIRDHDVAFAARLNEGLMRRMFDRLTRVERFSAAFVTRLRALSREDLVRELSRDPAGSTLLDARQLEGVMDRREAVLSHVDALIALHGPQSVLFFP